MRCYEMYQIINKNALDALKELPSESVDCIITSPPYYGLRSYKGADTIWGGDPNCEHEWEAEVETVLHYGESSKQPIENLLNKRENPDTKDHQKIKSNFCSKCGAWKGQLGLEPTYQLYIDHLMLITKELKRVLKKTGTMFWNMSDSYAGNMGWTEKYANKQQWHPEEQIKRDSRIQSKSLMLIPERFALAMLDDGWILRNKIIWRKVNGMPASVKDRFANKWEYVFFFTKSKKYYFDLDAVRKPFADERRMNKANKNTKYDKSITPGIPSTRDVIFNPLGANPGDVIDEKPYHPKGDPTIHGQRLPPQPGQKGAFNPLGANPGDILETPALRAKTWASTPGHKFTHERQYDPNADGGDFFNIATIPHKEAHFAVYPETLVAPFIKAGCPKPGVVLDPFAGSGTTGVVAEVLGRDSILIEISPEYCDIIKERLKKENVKKVADMLLKKGNITEAEYNAWIGQKVL